VIVPSRNEGDVTEIPEHERGGLDFAFVDEVASVLEQALAATSRAR
jgi:ATP-dependent Lon protease